MSHFLDVKHRAAAATVLIAGSLRFFLMLHSVSHASILKKKISVLQLQFLVD